MVWWNVYWKYFDKFMGFGIGFDCDVIFFLIYNNIDYFFGGKLFWIKYIIDFFFVEIL